MYCTNCGKQISDGHKFCEFCRTAQGDINASESGFHDSTSDISDSISNQNIADSMPHMSVPNSSDFEDDNADNSTELSAEPKQESNQTSDKIEAIHTDYINKLNFYIAHGSADDIKYAKVLRRNSSLPAIYVLLLAALVIALIFGSGWRFIPSVLLVIYIIVVKVKNKQATNYFKGRDGDVIAARQKYDTALSDEFEEQDKEGSFFSALLSAILLSISCSLDALFPKSSDESSSDSNVSVNAQSSSGSDIPVPDHMAMESNSESAAVSGGTASPAVSADKEMSSKYKNVFIIVAVALAVILVLLYILGSESSANEVSWEDQQYNAAVVLAQDGDYDQALEILNTIKGYRDVNRMINGINCISYADTVSNEIYYTHLTMSLMGMDVSCEYDPLNYKFVEVIEVPEDGLFGGLSSLISAFGNESVTYDEQGMKKLAKDMYNDYFATKGYSGITCVVEVRDYANDIFCQGQYPG